MLAVSSRALQTNADPESGRGGRANDKRVMALGRRVVYFWDV